MVPAWAPETSTSEMVVGTVGQGDAGLGRAGRRLGDAHGAGEEVLAVERGRARDPGDFGLEGDVTSVLMLAASLEPIVALAASTPSSRMRCSIDWISFKRAFSGLDHRHAVLGVSLGLVEAGDLRLAACC